MPIPPPQPGCVALVTGASSGIGREVARLLAERGHDLVIVARRRDRLEELAAELPGVRVEVIACDVSEPAARAELVARIAELGLTVDVLVPCAGFGMGGPFTAQDPDRIQLLLRTNVEAVFDLCRAFAPAMERRRRGAILLVSSMAGNQPMPNFGVYAASKAALTSFAEMLHEELRPSGVSVTALCPGGVATEFASVAEMSGAERRMRPFVADVSTVTRAGLQALDRGRRKVIPTRSARALTFAGGHLPRGLWLRACRRMLT